jgi:hypothetical protein
MGRHSKLCICVRCHKYPHFVLDEVDSIFHYSTTQPHVMLAIDRGVHNDTKEQEAIASHVKKHYPQVHIYKSQQLWGWGAGMYGLLCEAIDDAQKHLSFDHFLSIDYDALFIGEGADADLARDVEEHNVGLVGTVTPIGKTWGQIFTKRRKEILAMTGGKHPKEGWAKRCVYGAVMCISKKGLVGLRECGYLDDPFKDIRRTLRISDDPWLTFLVMTAGFAVKDNKPYCYNVWKNPEDYRLKIHRNPGLKIWHPAKMGPGGRDTNMQAETLCRNFFRRRRGKKAIKA